MNVNKIKTKQGNNLLYDLTILIYLIAYFFHYKDSEFDYYVRMTATIMLVVSLSILLVKRFQGFSSCTIWYTCFLILSILSTLWSYDAGQVKMMLVTLIRILLFGVLISLRVEQKEDVERILDLYLIATLYMCIRIGILMARYYSFSFIYVTRFGDNFGYNSNNTAIMCLICILICVHRLNIDTKIIYKIVRILFIVFFLIVLVATGSKKGYFGLILGIFSMLYLRNIGVKRIRNVFWALLIIAIIYIAIMSIPSLYSQIGSRLSSMFDTILGGSSSYSTSSRMELITQGFNVWLHNPILGVGLNNFSVMQTVHESWYAHCNYIELLADLGLIGLMLFYSNPLRLLTSKIDMNDDLGKLLKTIISILLILDFAMVSYQEVGFLIFYWLMEKVEIRQVKFVIRR